MPKVITYWMLASLGLAVVIILSGIVNQIIGAAINSPNGSFQDHLNTFLFASLLVPMGSVVLCGFVYLCKEILHAK